MASAPFLARAPTEIARSDAAKRYRGTWRERVGEERPDANGESARNVRGRHSKMLAIQVRILRPRARAGRESRSKGKTAGRCLQQDIRFG